MANRQLLTTRERMILLGMISIGAIGVAGGLLTHSHRVWFSFLQNSMFVLTIALGGALFVAIQNVSNAGWSAAIRRVPESMMTYLPVGGLLILAVFFGRHELYEWTHGLHSTSEAMKTKAMFLNTPSFFIRMLVIVALWALFSTLLWNESLKHDKDGSPARFQKIKALSAVFIVVISLSFSLASFDWIMSLEPEFYSTIFAFYCIAGLLLSSFAAITLLVIVLRRRGLLPQVKEDHLHSLGKLVFGFSTFWAYIWLSQYLLIYYANLPEETIYYIRRTSTPGWRALFIVNLLINWVAPFVILIARKAKRNESVLITGCAIVLVGHWLDLYVMVMPVHGNSAMIGLVDVAITFGFVGAFLFVVARSMSRVSLVPVHDPYLEESHSIHSFDVEPDHWTKIAARTLTLSTIGFGLTFTVWGLIGALAPTLQQLYNLTPTQTATLVAIPILLGSLGRVPVGICADRIGGRRVMGAVLILALVPAIIASFANNFAMLVVCAVSLGIVGTAFSAGVAMTSRVFSADEQGTSLGVYGLGNFGQLAAVVIAPLIVAGGGSWKLAFWVFGGAAALFGVIFLIVSRQIPLETNSASPSELLKGVTSRPIAWVMALIYFMTFGGFVALSIYLPTLLKENFGLLPADATLRVLGFVVVAVGARSIGGWLSDQNGGAPVLMVALIGVAVFALGLTSSSMIVFTFGALGSAAMLGAGSGALFKLVPEYFQRDIGTVAGFIGMAGGLGAFFPPILLAVIKIQTGSYAWGFLLLSAFAATCFVLNYVTFMRHQAQREEEEAVA